MLYEKYERHVRTNLMLVNLIRKYRILLVSVASVAFFLSSGYGIAKGMVYDMSIPASFVYGEEIDISSKAFFSGVTYAFRKSDQEEWVSETPRTAGDYQVKITTKPLFGEEKIKIVSFSVLPKTIELHFETTQIPFGDFPVIQADLANGDTIGDVSFTYEDLSSTETTAIVSSIVIVDSAGDDVTDSYVIESAPQTVRFVARSLTVYVPGLQSVYDGEALSNPQFEITEGSLLPGHSADILEYAEITDVGITENAVRIQIHDDQGTDLTENYDLHYEYGFLEVTARPITIQPADVSKIYDGSPLASRTAEIIQGTLVEGHWIEILTSGDQTEAGTGSSFIAETRIWDGETEVTANYDVHDQPGSLEVIPRAITIHTGSGERVYDGAPLSVLQYEITEGSLLAGHTARILEYADRTNAGTSENVLRLEISDGEEKDVTGNYQIGYEYGSLAVLPRPVSVDTGSGQKIYDGSPLSNLRYDISEGVLVAGHTTQVVAHADLTETGLVANILSIAILDDRGEDVSANYIIHYEYGSLEVEPRSVTIKPTDATKVYDGTLLTAEESETVLGALVGEHRVEIVTSGGLTDVGTGSSIILEVHVWDGTRDVTGNYDIHYEPGSLEVTLRPITLQPADVSKIYDGTPLASDSAEVILGSTVEGHRIEMSASGSQTNVGIGSSAIVDIHIWAETLEVTGNYDIRYEPGSLEVTPRPITLQPADVSKVYDGSSLTSDEAEIILGTLVEGHTVEIVTSGSQTLVGIGSSVITEVRVWNGLLDITGNYQIDCERGSLEVTRRPVTFFSVGDEKEYDGTPLSNLHFGLAEGSLVSGHAGYVLEYTAITRAGRSPNVLKIGIFDAHGVNISGNYEICYEFGFLEVTPRPIALLTESDEKEYDGVPLSDLHFDITAGSLLSGHAATVLEYTDRTDVGVSENVLRIRILDSHGTDLTENYEIYYEFGFLEVTPRPITLQPADVSKVYDGSPLTSGVSEILSGSLAQGHRIEILTSGQQTNVGIGSSSITETHIWEGQTDVTGNYEILLESGFLEVTPRPITIKTADVSKVYDGSPLTSNEAEIVSGTLVAGHRIDLSASGSQTEVGTDSNGIVESHIWSGLIDVSENYLISWENGSLEITPRPITLRPADVSKVYDGSPLFPGEAEVVMGTLVAGHRAEIVASGSRINVGIGVSLILETHVWSGETDVTGNYEIHLESGSLEVTPRPITFLTGTDQKEYDGTPLSDLHFDITEGSLVSGHEGFVFNDTEITDVGVSDNVLGIEIFDDFGVNVTANYEIRYEVGFLEVTPRPIAIGTGSSEKEYDGMPLTNLRYEVSGGTLVAGHTVRILDFAEQTDAGITDNLLWIEILDGHGEDVTGNYEIRFEYGQLTVTPRAITIQPMNVSKVYDGSPLISDEAEIIAGNLVEGHAVEIVTSGSQKDAGTGSSVIVEAHVWNGALEVTSNYEVLWECGSLDVTPRPITIQTGSDEKEYDGTPLLDLRFEIIEGSLVSGHLASIVHFADITDVGIVENGLTLEITDADEAIVTGNYLISWEKGSLEVTPRPITVETGSGEKEYDGTLFCYLQYEITEGSLVAGHSVNFAQIASLTEIGIRENEILIEIFDERWVNMTGNYEISYEFGSLKVTPRMIVISTASSHKIYDGTPLSLAEWELTSGSLLSDHQLSVTVTGTITEVGKTFNSVRVEILDSHSGDVSSYYTIVQNLGVLEIERTKTLLTLVSGSDSKNFDGLPLTCDRWELKEGELLEGHSLQIEVTGQITEIGHVPNTFIFAVLDSSGNDVTDDYYEIKILEGALWIFAEEGNGGNSASPYSISGTGSFLDGDPSIYSLFFRVYSEISDMVYLREKSYGDYVLNGWGTSAIYDSPYGISPLRFPSLAIGGSIASSEIQIQAVSGGLPYFLPYFSVDGFYDNVNDVYANHAYGLGYSLRYISVNDVDLAEISSSDSPEYEGEYREYVYQTYLQLPLDTRSTLLKIAEENGLDPKNATLIEDVQNYILSVGRYNYSFKPIPDNVDFALYFLEYSHEGICQHFATAATVMYRAMGIPARYVTGFAVPTQAHEWAEVTGMNYHAWVEIYIDGFGWIPIEVTPGGVAGGSLPGSDSAGGTGSDSDSGSDSGSGVPIEITSGNASKQYDGAPLTCDEYYFEGSLLEGHSLHVSISGTLTHVGEASNVFSVTVTDANGQDVTDQYQIRRNFGLLVVVPNNDLPIIEFQAYDITRIYDGTVVHAGAEDYWIVSGDLPEGYTVGLEIAGEIQNVGKVTIRIDKSSLRILDENNIDVTNRFNIVCYFGWIRVLQRSITITSFSAEKIYDGEPLTSDICFISKGSLVPGDEITVEIVGSITEIGVADNTIESVVIQNAAGEDVTKNYTITIVSGKLVIVDE